MLTRWIHKGVFRPINELNTAMQNIAESVDGIDFHIFVPPQPVKLGTVDIVMGVQVILGNSAGLHGRPQLIVFDHRFPPHFLLDFPLLLP